MEAEKNVLEAIKLRIDSLTANRNLFTVLFTIESAILTLMATQLSIILVDIRLGITIFLFGSTLVTMLLGIFALTDSIHSYSKYAEYRFFWNSEVHYQHYKKNYKQETPEAEINKDRITKSLWNALEADDYGYYCIKIGVLSFLLSLASFTTYLRFGYIIFIAVALVITYLVIKTYMRTHQRNTLKEATFKFFIREPIKRPKKMKEEQTPLSNA